MRTESETLVGRVRELALERPNLPYIHDAVADLSLTYGDVWTLSLAIAEQLKARGVVRRDVVATVLDQSGHAVPITLGIALAGAVEAPLNTAYMAPQFEYALADLDPRVTIASQKYLGLLEDLSNVIPSSQIVSDAAKDGPTDGTLYEPLASDIAWILYTSGTTGPSKGVRMPWRQIAKMAEGALPVASEDVHYCPYPLSHVSGRVGFIHAPTVVGSVVVRDGFSVSNFWPDIDKYRATSTVLMGATLSYVWSMTESDDDSRHSLRTVLMAPVPPNVEDVVRRYKIEPCTVFNMTEISSPIHDPGPVVSYDGSCGRVRDGYECRVVDELDMEVPEGVIGELIVRSDDPWSLMAGYLNKDAETVTAWQNMWFHTGDAFYRDASGRFHFVDRMKDCIRRRGENISSMELEGTVASHPAVAEAAALGVPSPYGEDDVKLVVVLREKASLSGDDLVIFLSDKVPRFALPSFIEFVDQIPKTATEKYKKTELRKMHRPEACWQAGV